MLLILLLAFAVQLALVVITDGYKSDVSCFSSWALRMADEGPSGFYAPEYFADYPPLYMLVLGGLGKIARILKIPYGTKAMEILLSLVPIACGLGCAVLIERIARQKLSRKAALSAAAMAAFCPPLLYDTGVWKQVDGVLCFLMVLCFWLLAANRLFAGAAVFGLALAVKPQPLLLGPVLAICFIVAILRQKDTQQRLKMVGKTVLSALLSVGVVILSALPFGISNGLGWLLDKYVGTVSSYPYASVNGFGLLALLGGNWKKQTEPVFGIVSWQMLGTVGIAAATLFLIYLTIRSLKHDRFCPVLLAAFYGTAVFALAHRMHERYILPAVLLTFAAAVIWNNRKMLGAFWLLSLSSLLNQAIVLTSNGTDDQFLTSSTAVIMIRIISLFTLAGLVMQTWAALEITGGKETAEKPMPIPAPVRKLPEWTASERMFLAGLTLLTGVVSLIGLGDTKAPQNPLDAIGTSKTETIRLEEPADVLRVYTGVTWTGSLTLKDANGEPAAHLDLSNQDAFKWKKVDVSDLKPGIYEVQLENSQMMEMAFLTDSGELVPASGEGALLDEQALVPKTFTYKNSTYFDEIYHGRTAYEHLHGMRVYETTHPPLGKVFIMLGIALFGMTGFGWRISGTLFGIALVPVLYLFVRRLTKSRFAAGIAAALCALDGLRFAQSRISTIDIYGTFFILLGAYFMVWYCQSVLEKGVDKSILPMALAGVAFGLGAASKWTGLYAGAGLAVVYFGVLWQRWKQNEPNFKRELKTAIVGGVLFFVIVPLIIYIGSYFPYWWRENGFSLAEWWNCQKTMLSYHSGLNATHPYESRWYTWLFVVRPVWYYSGGGNAVPGMHSGISGMGNPLVYWISTMAMGIVMWRQFSGRGSRAGGALVVFYLSQLLPWVIISRSTFAYHYFPSLWFAVAAVGLIFADWYEKQPKKAARTAAVLLAAALVVFIWFFPAVSGLTVPEGWTASMRWMKSWVF